MIRPLIIGISGGIASGKSEVTRILESKGAYVIRADKIGHQVLDDPCTQTLLIRQFGQSVRNDVNRSIDRKRLGSWVFGLAPQAIARRRMLESITHPQIRKRIQSELDDCLHVPNLKWIVLDIPLLNESGWDKVCDAVWFIESSLENRLRRGLARGWDVEHFNARESSQWNLERKLALATHVIKNNGSLEELKLEVQRALDKLIAR